MVVTWKTAFVATADLFTEIVRGIDQNLWFVESHSPLR